MSNYIRGSAARQLSNELDYEKGKSFGSRLKIVLHSTLGFRIQDTREIEARRSAIRDPRSAFSACSRIARINPSVVLFFLPPVREAPFSRSLGLPSATLRSAFIPSNARAAAVP